MFVLLMAASGAMVFLPDDLLRPAKNLAQSIAPFQLAARTAVRSAAESVKSIAERPATAEQHAELAREKQALENETAALRQQIAQLKSTVGDLAGIRAQGLADQAVLIPARVIGDDAAPGRDSQLVGKGRMSGVDEGDRVVSGLMVDAGGTGGVQGQAAVLTRECLIGWVAEAFPFTSRVVLLSDRIETRPMRVHIAPVAPIAPGEPDRQVLAIEGRPLVFVLQGAGGGRMRVRDIPTSLVEGGGIVVGDLITSDPADPRLPMPMVIGRIIELNRNLEQPLHCDAMVEPLYDPKELSQVYIVDLSPRAAPTPTPAAP